MGPVLVVLILLPVNTREDLRNIAASNPREKSRNDDSNKLGNFVSAGVEPVDVKRASVCRVLAVADVKVPSSNGIAL
jgi:hypothetical protein